MKRLLLIICLGWLPGQLFAENLVLMGNYYIPEVSILSQRKGVLSFIYGDSNQVSKIKLIYIAEISSELPEGVREITPAQYQEYIKQFNRNENATRKDQAALSEKSAAGEPLEQVPAKAKENAAMDIPQVEINNIEEACYLYSANRKDSGQAMLLALILPSAGHAYAGNWERGIIYPVLEVFPVGIMPFLLPSEWSGESRILACGSAFF
jgi:hypothetical protein